jgi:hypothetical protein
MNRLDVTEKIISAVLTGLYILSTRLVASHCPHHFEYYF